MAAPSFGSLLRLHRHAVGLTQEDLAERAEVSVRQLAYLERDKHVPRPGTVRRLAEALELSGEERAGLLAAVQEVAPERESPPRSQVILPVPPTPFIGRAQDLAQVSELLQDADVRLLVLVGSGGSGKTRLAIEAARGLLGAFPDGVVFVSLAALVDPDLLTSTIAATLGVREAPSHQLVESLRAYLGEKRLLLLLDNFEHLLPAASLISELLASSRRLKVLVTSRAVLHLAAEYEYAVPPLGMPEPGRLPSLGTLVQYDAVALFVERARAARATFSLTAENAPAVVEICRRLDGLPLAIELAAARARLFPPQAVLERLESGLNVLTARARDVPTRQQTIRNTIDWSYSLLSHEDRTLFRRLAVFVGGCTVEAAETVCGKSGDWRDEVLHGLESLMDQSLLVVDEQGGEPRFRMLETIREYALEQLEGSGEIGVMRRRHAEAFLSLAERSAERDGAETEDSDWIARLERENDNLRAALSWSMEPEGDVEVTLQLAGALARFWSNRLYFSEGRPWLERIVALSPSSQIVERNPRAWAQILTGIAAFAATQGDFGTAQTYAERAEPIWRALNDKRGLGSTLRALGWVTERRGDHDQARSLLKEQVEVARNGGSVKDTIRALRSLAVAELVRGNLVGARRSLEEALGLARKIGYTAGLPDLLCKLAEVSWCQGDTAAQSRYYADSLSSAKLLTEPTDLFHVLGLLAGIASRACDYEQAETLLGERLSLARNQVKAEEAWWFTAWALNHLGDVLRSRGDEEQAVSVYEQSLTLFRQRGERQGIAAVLHNLGHVALLRSDARHARELFVESLSLFRELNFAWSIADCVTGLAGVAGQQGHPQVAAVLYGAAEAAHEAVDASGILVDPANHLAWESEIIAVRGDIDEETWAKAWEAGRSMSLDQALAWADRASR